MALIPGLVVTLDQLRAALQAELVKLETLPADLKRDWVAPDGRVRVEAFPKGDANDNATLQRFTAAVRQVAPEATGTIVGIQESSHTIVKAFLEAGLWALLSITLLLAITLRRATDVLLTLLPLTLAGLVTLGTCVAVDLPLNFENIIALPLLFGIGVAFSIYFVMAWRRGSQTCCSRASTRAVLFSALTTGTAFGSLVGLASSRHREHGQAARAVARLYAGGVPHFLTRAAGAWCAWRRVSPWQSDRFRDCDLRSSAARICGDHWGACRVRRTSRSCADAPGTRDTGNDDPFEPLNRVVFNANDAVDTAVIRPMAEAYRAVFPQFVRDRIKAFVDNLQEPRIFANNLLQLRINDAGFTFARFYCQLDLGPLGLFDIASEHGLPKQTGDFGETLYVWGVDSGPYLVLPLFGPSNPARPVRPWRGPATRRHRRTSCRATLGSGSMSASTWSAASICGQRNIETLEQIKAHALDYYAQFRSIVRQHREAQLAGGARSGRTTRRPGRPGRTREVNRRPR